MVDTNASPGSAPAFAAVGIEMRDLVVSYGDGPVVHGVSLEVEPGETLSLLGPSGCGKTTLLRTIAGLQRAGAGTITIGDRLVAGPTTSVAPHRRRVGMVFQDGALFPHLNAADNVGFGLVEMPDGRSRLRRIAEVLELVGMGAYANRMPDTLSGGQRQRVALARALAPRPAVLLLDEPFSALDAGLRSQIRRDVKRILNDVGITSVVVTHDQDEAFVLGDRVAAMHRGKIVQVGPSTELYDRPRDRWVASFVGEANVVRGVVDGAGKVVTMLGPLERLAPASPKPIGSPDGDRAAIAKNVDVLIRPEHLGLEPGGEGRITLAEHFGHDALYEVDVAGTQLVVRTTDVAHEVGERVRVRFDGPPVVTWPGREMKR